MNLTPTCPIRMKRRKTKKSSDDESRGSKKRVQQHEEKKKKTHTHTQDLWVDRRLVAQLSGGIEDTSISLATVLLVLVLTVVGNLMSAYKSNRQLCQGSLAP